MYLITSIIIILKTHITSSSFLFLIGVFEGLSFLELPQNLCIFIVSFDKGDIKGELEAFASFQ